MDPANSSRGHRQRSLHENSEQAAVPTLERRMVLQELLLLRCTLPLECCISMRKPTKPRNDIAMLHRKLTRLHERNQVKQVSHKTHAKPHRSHMDTYSIHKPQQAPHWQYIAPSQHRPFPSMAGGKHAAHITDAMMLYQPVSRKNQSYEAPACSQKQRNKIQVETQERPRTNPLEISQYSNLNPIKGRIMTDII